MIKKEIFILLLSIAVGIAIITVLSFFIIWIGFPVSNPKESFKDALEFSGNLFGGLATFGAAIVAAYLFNDWKDEYSQNLNSSILLDFLKQLDELEEYAQSLLTFLMANSQAELDYIDERVTDIPIREFLKTIKIHESKYEKSNYKKFTVGNKFYILGGDYYAESIGFIVASINEAFFELREIAGLDKKNYPLSHILIQKRIDAAINELNEGLEILNSSYSIALNDLKPSK